MATATQLKSDEYFSALNTTRNLTYNIPASQLLADLDASQKDGDPTVECETVSANSVVVLHPKPPAKEIADPEPAPAEQAATLNDGAPPHAQKDINTLRAFEGRLKNSPFKAYMDANRDAPKARGRWQGRRSSNSAALKVHHAKKASHKAPEISVAGRFLKSVEHFAEQKALEMSPSGPAAITSFEEFQKLQQRRNGPAAAHPAQLKIAHSLPDAPSPAVRFAKRLLKHAVARALLGLAPAA